MSKHNTFNNADLPVVGPQSSTTLVLADIPGVGITLPKTRAQVGVKPVVRDARVTPKFLGMKADDLRRFTFV